MSLDLNCYNHNHNRRRRRRRCDFRCHLIRDRVRRRECYRLERECRKELPEE